MKSHEILLLPYIDTFAVGALRALRNGDAAAICGDEGYGVTTTCAVICTRWKAEEAGRYLRITAFRESDHLKLTQHLALTALGAESPSDSRIHCASTLWNLIGKKLQQQGIGMLQVDRADLAPPGFMDSLMSMASECRLAGVPVGILLGIRHQRRQRALFDEANSTCVAYTGRIEALSPAFVLAVLSEFKVPVQELQAGVEKNDPAHVNALKRLTQLSDGNFRRLDQFAAFIRDNSLSLPGSAEQMEKLWKRGFEADSGG